MWGSGKAMLQGWFNGGPSGDGAAGDGAPSLLSQWNSYAEVSRQEAGGLDVEAGALFKSANDTISGAFSTLSKGVRELPGSVQSATSGIPSGKAITYFALLLGSGVFFLFISFTMFLPVIVLVPQKFASCFTIGCLLVMGSFFALKGPRAQFAHMISQERLPFTAAFVGSIVATIYASMVLHSYLFSVLFSVVQLLALLYYVISYFPGGSSGLTFISSMAKSSASRVFGG
ncbi:protein transport protein SFT2 [Selaginella moellendorffii]|nr:protein transport protein SFT2 [Selaginella moellendorffii]|eukprot:XP_002975940.2 protein transport protein SFT2 [Selaginella moellendorffii]